MSRVLLRLKRWRQALFKRLTSWLSRTLSLHDPKRDLSSILLAADLKAPLIERIFWASQLIDWLRGGKLHDGIDQSSVRIRFLLQVLERQPDWKANVGAVILSILEESQAPFVFAQTELTEQAGFITEFLRRIFEKFIPVDPRPQELAFAVSTIFTEDSDPEWLENISENDWKRIEEVVEAGRTLLPATATSAHRLERDVAEAVVKLSIQAAALGLNADVRRRLVNGDIQPFVTLNREAVAWREKAIKTTYELRGSIAACEIALAHAFAALEKTGVSVAIVYRLETINGLLRRLDLLVDLFDVHSSGTDRIVTVRDLLLEIVRTHRSRYSALTLLRLNFDIFARKLVEHAGESGEHYITRTRSEYFEMFVAGAGGGLITVLTTLIKFGISALRLPLFFEGFFVWINYSLSFIVMQGFGFALATKQPSMTAAALAGKLSERLDRSRLAEFVTEVARISRSQFIAAVGNVLLVVAGSVSVDVVYELVTGHHILSSDYARKSLDSFHPWKSGTVFYAAFTGVILWISSFGAGWLQNWAIYRRINDAIAHHRRLRSLIGEKRARALGDFIAENASGLGGNVAIGCLLAFVPIVGKIFGIPLDIRHVTLTAGSMAFDFRALDPTTLTSYDFAVAGFGLAMIGVMNFTVATVCALIVAVRARRVRKVWFHAMLVSVRRAILTRPLPFFFPTAEDEKRVLEQTVPTPEQKP